MKIAIIGTRGIPNRYGGFEQFASFIAPMLVKRGHQVVVYNSSTNGYKSRWWKGVEIVTRYDPQGTMGMAAQFIYDLLCILDTRKRDFDVIFQLGYTSSSIWDYLFPQKSLLVTNMDGLEWKRQKYSPLVRRFLQYVEKRAALNSDVLVADAMGIREYLFAKYGKEAHYIPYGARPFYEFDPSILVAFNLTAYRYNLVIARSEPENHIETIIKGCLGDQKPLVIIGNANSYGKHLRKKYSGGNMIFLDCIYDMHVLNNLRHFSHFYFHGHSVGGTNPSLLEAMAAGCLVLAHDNMFNREVLGRDAFYFTSEGDIRALLKKKLQKSDHASLVENNLEKITGWYNWENILILIEEQILKVKDGILCI